MTRYTAAYSGFIRRVPEVDVLRKLAERNLRLSTPIRSSRIVNPLCRASIVLLSSHIEGYVEDLAEVILDRIVESEMQKNTLASRFLYYFSKDIVDEIRETRDPDKVAEKLRALLNRDMDIWSTESTFQAYLPVERFISGFSTPKFEEVCRFIGRFGYQNYKRDLQRLLQANFQSCTNMVNNVVEQRNRIAHGDASISATPGDIVTMLDLVQTFCRSTDVVVGDWFKSVGCSIR